MKLSTRGRYGTRLMLELAIHFGKGPLSIAEISRSQRIPVKYLEQLIIPLKKAKLVTSLRGPKGGHMLSIPPGRISLWDILVQLESTSSLVDCLVDETVCQNYKTCLIRPVWGQALQAMTNVLKKTSLQSILDSNSRPRRRELKESRPSVEEGLVSS